MLNVYGWYQIVITCCEHYYYYLLLLLLWFLLFQFNDNIYSIIYECEKLWWIPSPAVPISYTNSQTIVPVNVQFFGALFIHGGDSAGCWMGLDTKN